MGGSSLKQIRNLFCKVSQPSYCPSDNMLIFSLTFSHNNRTAQYTNPAIQSRHPPPSYHEAVQNAEEDAGRRAPTRSHSHR